MYNWNPFESLDNCDDILNSEYVESGLEENDDNYQIKMFVADENNEENVSNLSFDKYSVSDDIDITRMIRRSGMSAEQPQFKISSKTTIKNTLPKDNRMEMYGMAGVYLDESFFKLEPVSKENNIDLSTLNVAIYKNNTIMSNKNFILDKNVLKMKANSQINKTNCSAAALDTLTEQNGKNDSECSDDISSSSISSNSTLSFNTCISNPEYTNLSRDSSTSRTDSSTSTTDCRTCNTDTSECSTDSIDYIISYDLFFTKGNQCNCKPVGMNGLEKVIKVYSPKELYVMKKSE